MALCWVHGIFTSGAAGVILIPLVKETGSFQVGSGSPALPSAFVLP